MENKDVLQITADAISLASVFRDRTEYMRNSLSEARAELLAAVEKGIATYRILELYKQVRFHESLLERSIDSQEKAEIVARNAFACCEESVGKVEGPDISDESYKLQKEAQ